MSEYYNCCVVWMQQTSKPRECDWEVSHICGISGSRTLQPEHLVAEAFAAGRLGMKKERTERVGRVGRTE